MANEVIGHGSTFNYETSAGPPIVYGSLFGVTSIDFGSDKVDAVDNTDMGTAGSTRTYISGLENPGDVTVKFNVKPGDATQIAFRALKGTGVTGFQVNYPGTVRTRTFSGIIVSIDESVPGDKIPTCTAKIQISGPIVDTIG